MTKVKTHGQNQSNNNFCSQSHYKHQPCHTGNIAQNQAMSFNLSDELCA